MKGTLTEIAIKNAKPGNKRRTIFDGGGLFIVVEPTGGKLWRFQYRFDGKRKLLALGKYPDVSLQEARKRHSEARERLAQGIDPSVARKVEKQIGAERAANTFEFVAREWLTVWSKDKVKTTIDHTHARFRNDILPTLGGKPIASITTPDVLTALRRIEGRGAIETAHRSKNIISQIMRYAVSTARAGQNPVLNIDSTALQSRPVKHMASITEPVRVAELLRAIDAYSGTYQVQAALRLAPLVFVRIGELRTAKWVDIDFDRAEWKYTVSKTKTEHHVPLAWQAVEILKELYMLTGNEKYVFPGLRSGRPISDMTINRALQSMGYDTKEEMTGHGFRAMARTLIAEELHYAPEVIEHQLAHSVPDALGTAYNRTKYLKERKVMMQAYADYLDDLKTGSIVVKFPMTI